jgi:hypothetical protein
MTSQPRSEEFHEEQAERDHQSRLKTLTRLLAFAQRQQMPAVVFLDIVEQLDLDEELDELAATSTERQERLAAARLALQLQLADRAEGELWPKGT